eukprot:3208728-Rhodomonas_salina.1
MRKAARVAHLDALEEEVVAPYPMVLRMRYAMSGTDKMLWCYAKSGPDVGLCCYAILVVPT